MKKKAENSTFNLAGRSILSTFVSGSLAYVTPDEGQEEKLEVQKTQAKGTTQWLPINAIQPSVFQPRQFFSEAGIESLAKSFKEQGFRGAINVRPSKEGTYELIAGERRWRAAKRAGLTDVRCIVDEYTDEEALEFALIENLQREDLSKLEETEGILKLIEAKLGIARERAIALIRTEGHSDKRARSGVAPSDELRKIEAVLSSFAVELQTFRTKNLRTLTLPDDLKKAHLEKGISYSAALELVKVKDAPKRELLLERALNEKLSIREIQEWVRAISTEQGSTNPEGETSLVKRLVFAAKRLNKAAPLLNKTHRLERLLQELEALLEETGATSLRREKKVPQVL